MNRKHFLKLGATGMAAAALTRNFAMGQSSPAANRQLNVAVVGAGNMGAWAIDEAALTQNLVAICDVDWRLIEGRAERSAIAMAEQHPQAKRFEDYREMLAAMGDQIDVVLISTPDHTHFPIAMACMEAGKHVFVQKPLAHNIWQCRTLKKAMDRYGVVTNMGNQGHTFDGMRMIKEWVDRGIVGEVREVHCWTDRPMMPWFRRMEIPPRFQAAPKGVNWDLWLGPAKGRPYSDQYVPTLWRGWWDFGCGSLGDIGCHCLDAPFWALKLGMPTAVDVRMDEPVNKSYSPFGAHVTFHFSAREGMPPVDVHWYEGRPQPPRLPGMTELPSNGIYMVGSNETLFHPDMRPRSPQLWPRERMQAHREVLREKTLPRVKGGPIQELFQAITGEGPKPGSSFDYAAPLTEMVLLGAMAIRAGHRIEYDADTMTVTNRRELSSWIKEPVREGWSYGEDLWG
jgi:predicted dehydrogenase